MRKRGEERTQKSGRHDVGTRVFFLIWSVLFSFFAILPAGLGRVSAQSGNPPGSSIPLGEDAVLYQKAVKSFDRGDMEHARKWIRKILMQHPRSVKIGPARLLLGRIESRSARDANLGKTSRNRALRQAIRLYWQAHDANPPGWDRGRVAYRMGELMDRMGFFAEARGYLELSVREAPGGPRFFDSRILLAEILRKEGHPGQAQRVIERLSSRVDLEHPGNRSMILPLLYEGARIKIDLGDVKNAGDLLEKALSLDGSYPYKHPEDLFVLATYADREGHNRRAFALYRNFLRFGSASPLVPEALYRMALLSGRMGKEASAQARLLELIHEYPSSEWADRGRLEVAHIAGKRLSQKFPPGQPHSRSALDQKIERLLAVNLRRGSVSSRVMSLSMTAPLLARRSQWREALKNLHRISIDTDPKSPDGQRLAGLETALVTGWIIRQSEPFRPDRIVRIVQDYGYALKRGIRDPRATLFEIAAQKEMPRVYELEGKAQDALGHPDRALKWYRKGLQIAGLAWRARILGDLVRIQEKTGDLGQAWADGQTLLLDLPPHSPDRPVWMGRLARLARRRGENQREADLLRQRVRAYPEDSSTGRSLVRLFVLDRKDGNASQAEKDARLAKVFLDDSRDPADRKALGGLLYHWGKWERDIHHPQRAYRLLESFVESFPQDPRSGWALYQLGNIALALGDAGKARDWFLKVTRAESGSPLGKVARERARGIRLKQEMALRGY